MTTRRNSTTGRKAAPPDIPTKHDVVAQVLHFVHYIEDLAAMPKGLRYNIDTSVIKQKCEQLKAILERVGGD